MQVEPMPGDSGPGVVDPKDPDIQRRFEIQRRGGAFSDRLKFEPGGNMDEDTMRPRPIIDRT